MPQNLGTMIQMLSTLAEMQDRRRQFELDKQKLEEQKHQFVETLGVTKEDQHFRNISKIMDQISQGGASAATAVHELAPMMGLGPEEAQMFAHMAPSAATAVQQLQAVQAKRQQENVAAGQASMTPSQLQQMQQEAANTTNTGMNSGQMATGNLIAQMANQGASQITPGAPSYSKDMADRVSQAYMFQNAAHQTPDQFAKGQAFIDRGMGPAAASIESGITPSAGQMLGFQANMADVRGRMAGQNPMANISDTVGGINTLHQIAKDLADGKYGNENTADTMIRQYNALAALLASQGIQISGLTSKADAPTAVGRLQGWINKMQGSAAPPPVSPALVGKGGGMRY